MFDEQIMISNFVKFHDIPKLSEAMYTDDILSLLKSIDPVTIEKVNNIIKVRTDNNFYLQCHVIAKIFHIAI